MTGKIGLPSVWASHRTKWAPNPDLQWEIAVGFSKFVDLPRILQEVDVERGTARRIAIHAHGDAPGRVQMEAELSPQTAEAPPFRSALGEVGSFLREEGCLIFFSCISGRGQQGSNLLTAISNVVKDRYIIGFSVFLMPIRHIAGDVVLLEEGGGSMHVPSRWVAENRDSPRIHKGSKFAKWALNGRIVRKPEFFDF